MSNSRIPERLFAEGEGKGISRRDFLKVGGLGLMGASLLGAAGCGSVFSGGGNGGGGNGGGGSNTLNYNMGADIPDLDVSTSTDVASAAMIGAMYDTLYRLDEQLIPKPALASGHTVSADKLTYTFKLRDGIKWSDGSPITSKDFKYSWLRTMDPKTASQYSFILADYIKGGSDYANKKGPASNVAIETPDDKTVRVTLANPTPYFLSLAAFKTYVPLKQSFVEKLGDKFSQSPQNILYCGPYKLTTFSNNNGGKLVKNKNYWNVKAVSIPNINVQVVKDQNTALNLYQSGGLDEVVLTAENVSRFKNSKEFHRATEFASWYLTYNYKHDAAMRNKNIRLAITKAVDTRALADQVLKDGSTPATGLVPPKMAGVSPQKPFRTQFGDAAPKYDPQQAKKLWQQGSKELGGAPKLTLLSQDSSTAKDIATFIQSQLKKNLGANVAIDQQPFKNFLALISKGNFQFTNQGWAADYNDPSTFMDLFVTGSTFDTSNYSNPKYDSLVKGARSQADNSKRMQAFAEAEKLLLQDDVGIGMLYFQGVSELVKPYLTIGEHNPFGIPDFLNYKLHGKK